MERLKNFYTRLKLNWKKLMLAYSVPKRKHRLLKYGFIQTVSYISSFIFIIHVYSYILIFVSVHTNPIFVIVILLSIYPTLFSYIRLLIYRIICKLWNRKKKEVIPDMVFNGKGLHSEKGGQDD